MMNVLTVNTGSSSIKAGLFQIDGGEEQLLTATVERIGLPAGRVQIRNGEGAIVLDQTEALPNHDAALQMLFTWMHEQGWDANLDAVGHRVVHGGSRYAAPQLLDAEVIAALRKLAPIDPDHLPQALDAIQTVSRLHPAIPQAACFDTAFHRTMPRKAQLYALPHQVRDAGVLRYGFHGLSYEFILHELRRQARAAADGRLIIAHLGNGASMVAVHNGVSVDTTMGFTPTGGLMMGARCGDLDPGVLLYLLQEQGMKPAALNDLVNHQSGLLGVSGSSGDMRDLLQREANDPLAAEAIELFCYQAQKFLGSLCTALGGLETLVFTGGIGEHAAPVRQRICAGLEFLGIRLDPERNAVHAAMISHPEAPVTIRVMHTDENRMIARHTYRLVQQTVARTSA